MVPVSSIIMMVVSMLCGIAIPIVLAIYIKKKYKTSLAVFFIGFAVWFVFAQVLEGIMHAIVLSTDFGMNLTQNIVGYAIYGGLAAGIFEEVGRFLSMKLLMKKKYGNRYNALMYGAGHGGFEAAYILVIGMISNIVLAVLINTHQTSALLQSVPGPQSAQLRETLIAVAETAPHMYLLGIVERLFAVTLHISFSVLVWFAVTKKKTILFPLAILLHACVDAIMAIVAGYVSNVWLVELVIFVMAVATAVIAWFVWKKNKEEL